MSDVLCYVGYKIHHITIQHYLIIDIDEYAYLGELSLLENILICSTQNGTVYLLNKITKQKCLIIHYNKQIFFLFNKFPSENMKKKK